MHVQTNNFEAFDQVTGALKALGLFRHDREISRLQEAKKLLNRAQELDPDYFTAKYYHALTDELLGNRDAARTSLRHLLRDADAGMNPEVRYNLAVAEYHGYSHADLDVAIAEFEGVLRDSEDRTLTLLATAGLAQAHAMHEIPKSNDDKSLEARRATEQHYGRATALALSVLQSLRWGRFLSLFRKAYRLEPDTAIDIAWAAQNALGMANMYKSDTVDSRDQRVPLLERALSALVNAEELLSNRWENVCDLASANMRLGYAKGDEAAYDECESLLTKVIFQLRPGYKFALYELGRLNRLRGDFDRAATNFHEALESKEGADVSDKRIRTEIERATKRDRTFP